MSLNLDDILNADDLKREVVDVPEWGGTVIVQTMTGTARDAYESSIIEIGKDGKARQTFENLRAKLLAATLITEDGKPLCRNAKDIQALGKKSAAVLDRLFAIAQKLNAVSDADIEELAKNS